MTPIPVANTFDGLIVNSGSITNNSGTINCHVTNTESGTASGFTPNPVTFTQAGLPAGLVISAAGGISGAPTSMSAAGTATITASYDSNTSNITIDYAAVSAAVITPTGATVSEKTYDGTTSAGVTNVAFEGLKFSETLAFVTDYTVSGAIFDDENVANATSVTGTVALTGTDLAKHYILSSGTFSQTANITKAKSSVTANPIAADLTYAGNLQNLLSSAGTASGGALAYSLEADGAYTSTIPQGLNAGQYDVYYKVIGDSNHNDYKLESPINVSIAAKSISGAEVTIDGAYSYTGSAIVPESANISVTMPGLTPTYTYEVTSGGTNAGAATVTVTGTDNFTGTATGMFEILPISPGLEFTSPSYTASYGGSTTISAASAGGANIVYSYKLSGAAEWTAGLPNVSALAVGTYDLKATVAAEGNYTADEATATLTINATTHTVAFVNGYGGTISTQTVTHGGDAVPPSNPTRSGYTFNGWSGSYKNVTADVTITATWTQNSGGGYVPVPNPAPNPEPSPPAPAPSGDTTIVGVDNETVQHAIESESYVIVDGEAIQAGEVKVTDTTTTTIVKPETVTAQMETAKENVTVIVPSAAENKTVEAQLVVRTVEDVQANHLTLTIAMEDVAVSIPQTAIDTSKIKAALGYENSADAPVTISVTKVETPAIPAAPNAATQETVAVYHFEITASYNGKAFEVTRFNAYVSRDIEVTAEQAKRITTAVVIEPDGSQRHVPTYVYEQNGKWYAKVNSRTNSDYALIYNEVEFSDAAGKWYEDIVNEMGSREIINGVGGGLFAGENDITRAEYAAILVRALGLPQNAAASTFDDVPQDAWYAGSVGAAYEYGLIQGRVAGKIFDPTAKITRAEALIMTRNACKIAELDPEQLIMYDTERDADNITRSETATLVLRMLQTAALVDKRSET